MADFMPLGNLTGNYFCVFQTENLRTSSEGGSVVHQEFETFLQISHYYAIWSISRACPSMEQVAFKIATAMLRYSDVIPADKAFYEAGMAARVSKN